METLRDPRPIRPDHDLLARLIGDYYATPELCVSVSQAQDRWRLDETTCRSVLDRLVRLQLLTVTSDGCFVRSDRAHRFLRRPPATHRAARASGNQPPA